MEVNSEKELIDLCATICYYAQSHSQDWHQDFRGEEAFQHTSFTIACFVAQFFDDSVEWDFVLEELMGEVKLEPQWIQIFTEKFKWWSD